MKKGPDPQMIYLTGVAPRKEAGTGRQIYPPLEDGTAGLGVLSPAGGGTGGE